jgi:hypothetical protein
VVREQEKERSCISRKGSEKRITVKGKPLHFPKWLRKMKNGKRRASAFPEKGQKNEKR